MGNTDAPRPGGLLATVQAMLSAPKSCKMGAALAKVSSDERDALENMVKAENIPYRVIRHHLNSLGFPLAESTVRGHSLGECCCTEPHAQRPNLLPTPSLEEFGRSRLPG